MGRLGVHGALSLPLLVPGQVLGALNVYAHGRDVFDERAVVMGEAFSPQAAVSVHNAQLLDQAERAVAQLQQALTSRAEIDQALGVMMSRTGGTAQEAFDTLRAQSQARSVKLTEIAREVLVEAVRRGPGPAHPGTPRATGPGSGRLSNSAAQT